MTQRVGESVNMRECVSGVRGSYVSDDDSNCEWHC